MAITPINVNLLKKPPSTPLQDYVFEVRFEYAFSDDTLGSLRYSQEADYEFNTDSDNSLIAIKVDLPAMETNLVTKKFLGTEKSFPVLRKYAGDTTLEFYARSDPRENKFTINHFFRNLDPRKIYYHNEFHTVFNKIIIKVGDRPNGGDIYRYNLVNCIVTKVDQGSMSYENGGIMKYTMTVHYDDWFVETNEDYMKEMEDKEKEKK